MIHAYKLGGFNIVIDVASGSIHSVDNAAFDVIRMYESIDRSAPADGDTLEILSEIDELKRAGKLFAPDKFAPIAEEASANSAKTPLKALCMNVSHMCNMTCGYCFAGRVFTAGGGELMTLETGRRAIYFLAESSGPRKNLDIDFFGGEPLLNWGVVKDIVRYARKIEQGSGGNKKFRFTLTTNGLLIDDDVIDFTCREMHNVVLSLDGRPEINDAARKFHDGGGTYADVVPKFKRLVDSRGGKGYYIRGTFTRGNLDFVDDVLHIADLGFTELSMEPAVGKADALTAEDLPKLREEYERLAAEMISRKKEGRGFTFYHYMLDLAGGPCIHKRIAGCGVGTEYLAVTPRGDLYPCHQFVGDESFIMGDVWRGVTNHKLRGELSGCSIYTRKECRDCWARMYCSGYGLGCELFKKRVECAVMLKVAEAQGFIT
jgi:uncharacterized protein